MFTKFFLLPLVLLAAFANVANAAAKRGDIVYQSAFADAASLTDWQGIDGSAIHTVSMPDGGTALHVEATPAGSHTVTASLPIPIEKLRGIRVVVSAKVKAADIVKPEHAWNGVKVMLHITNAGGEQYDQGSSPDGTFDWREVRFGSEIAENAVSAQLVLGIENTTGAADFEDIRITVLEAPRPPMAAPSRGSVYTGHAATPLRGAMVADNIDETGAAKLANDWKANVVRFQLVGSRAGGPTADYTPAYNAWLESELGKLDRFLPIAQKYGLKVVVDMHSAPGGRISPWIGDRIFEDVRYQDKLAEAWDIISKRYRGNPAIWGYDLCNEPLERTTRENIPSWQDLATRLAKIVRANDSDHTIIVESMNSDAENFRYLTPIAVPGIVYSAHIYTPYAFTMQGIGGPWTPVSYPGTIGGAKWDKARLQEVVKPIVEFQQQCHTAIYIGEFSAVRWAPGGTQWLRDLIDIFEAHHWDWTYHAFREWKGWDAEIPADHDATTRTTVETEREALLKSYFARDKVSSVASQ